MRLFRLIKTKKEKMSCGRFGWVKHLFPFHFYHILSKFITLAIHITPAAN